MITQCKELTILNTVELEPNSKGDVLLFQEVIVDASEVDDGEVEQETVYRFAWENSDDSFNDEQISFPAGTDIVGLVNKAKLAGWYK